VHIKDNLINLFDKSENERDTWRGHK